MQNQDQPNRKPRHRSNERGRYKMAVYFVDHEPGSRANYFFTNAGQDKIGKSVSRLQNLVLKKWKGKVKWAAIYENEQMISEFRQENHVWEARQGELANTGNVDPNAQGRFKLAMYFINNTDTESRPVTLHSTIGQDYYNVSIERFQNLVSGKYKGRISWAGIYQDGQLISEFKAKSGWKSKGETKSDSMQMDHTARGRFKMGIYFVNHQNPDGKALYLYSTVGQDFYKRSLPRFKKMVLEKWHGKVNWAAIYENEYMISEFKLEHGAWEAR